MVKVEQSKDVLRIAVIGAGVRGNHLAEQLRLCPQSAQVVAMAEPNEKKRNRFAQVYRIAEPARFSSWEELCGGSLEFDAAIIATMDNQHSGPALACLRRGCHILVEKPLAHTLEDCHLIEATQRKANLIVSVCHTLRYMDAFKRIKKTVADGVIGRLIHIDHMEAIGHLKFTHNYVRGRWAKEESNTFLLLHKCSHDVDFIAWLVDKACLRVSSFGCLSYFRPSNAPNGAGKRCLDNCRIEDKCPYSAALLYLDGELRNLAQDLSDTHSREALLKAIQEGPFGACVWHAHNDVVDHQVVSMEFEEGTTATCTMSGYSSTHGRRTRLHGTKGELLFDEATGSITLNRFSEQQPEYYQIERPDIYHPEDKDIVKNWLCALSNSSEKVCVDASEALRTHAIVFAAEVSRRERRVVELSDFISAF